jgi:hypothetical protein
VSREAVFVILFIVGLIMSLPLVYFIRTKTQDDSAQIQQREEEEKESYEMVEVDASTSSVDIGTEEGFKKRRRKLRR